jgi:hypothetical protein
LSLTFTWNQPTTVCGKKIATHVWMWIGHGQDAGCSFILTIRRRASFFSFMFGFTECRTWEYTDS